MRRIILRIFFLSMLTCWVAPRNGVTQEGRPSPAVAKFGALLQEVEAIRSVAEARLALMREVAARKMPGPDIFALNRLVYNTSRYMPRLYVDSPDLTKNDLLVYRETVTKQMASMEAPLREVQTEGVTFSKLIENQQTGAYVFLCCDGHELCAYSIRLSPSGLFGAAIDAVMADAYLNLGQLHISLVDKASADRRSAFVPQEVSTVMRKDALEVTHRFGDEHKFTVKGTATCDQGMLCLSIDSPVEMHDLWIGEISAATERVHVAPGNVVERPKESFILRADDKKLGSGIVGFEFAGGISLAQACEGRPDFLEVDLEKGRYALHTRSGGKFWIVVTGRGAPTAIEKCRQAAGLK